MEVLARRARRKLKGSDATKAGEHVPPEDEVGDAVEAAGGVSANARKRVQEESPADETFKKKKVSHLVTTKVHMS